MGNSLPENVDYINSCANFTKNNVEQTIAQFYTKYIPNEKRNFTNILSLKLTSAEKNSLNLAQQDTNVAQIAQKANSTRKDLLYAELTDNVDDYYDCIYPDDEEIPNSLTREFALQKLKSKEKMMQELKSELNNSIIRGESAQDVIINTNGIFEKHSESLPNIVQNFEEKVSTYLAVQQGEEQGFKYYLHICNAPETACGICAPLHNTVHPTSDLESMPPHHLNCKCTLVLLDEAYIQSLENTNKKSDDNFWTKLLDGFQTALDLAGFIPVFGEIADGTNAAIYLARGDYFNASLSATAMIPYLGWFSTGSKLGRKALKAADKIDDVARIVNKADDVSGAVKGTGKVNSTKPYINSRPSYGKTQVDDVWNAKVDQQTGTVRDPSGADITWDRTMPRKGQWDMGHIPEQKYSDMHGRYMRGEISKEDFLKWYRDSANYRPELPSTNRGHMFEK